MRAIVVARRGASKSRWLAFAAERLGPDARIERPLALALLLHDWPDNVRGLRAIVEAAAVEAAGGCLALTPRVQRQLDDRKEEGGADVAPSEAARYRKERPEGDYLVRRLAQVGNVKALALELGVARNTLYRWLREADIDPKEVLG